MTPQQEVLITLNDHERRMVEPFVKQQKALRAELRKTEETILRMVAMREPRVMDNGVEFNPDTYQVTRSGNGNAAPADPTPTRQAARRQARAAKRK